MSVSETFRGVVDQPVESMESASAINGFHLEPRCRTCRNDSVRTKVNDLLATGASYAMVLRALADDHALGRLLAPRRDVACRVPRARRSDLLGVPHLLFPPHPYWIMTRPAPLREQYERTLARAIEWGFVCAIALRTRRVRRREIDGFPNVRSMASEDQG